MTLLQKKLDIIDTTSISDPHIYVWDKKIPHNVCKNIISKFEKNIEDSYQGSTLGGVDLDIKNSTDLFISRDLDTWQEEDTFFCNVITQSINDYYEHLNTKLNYYYFTNNDKHIVCPVTQEVIDSGYQIQKTEAGKGYVWHHDFQYENDLARTHTFILYLNTVEEGWTQFYNGDQIAPITGKLLIFPATWTYLHQGYPPKQTKYIMTGWLHAKPKCS